MARPKLTTPRKTKTVRIDAELEHLDLTAVVRSLELYYKKICEVSSLIRHGKPDSAKELKFKIIEEIGLSMYKILDDASKKQKWSGCTICGTVPLVDFACSECGSYAMADADEGSYEYDSSNKYLYIVEFDGERGDKVKCDDCGNKTFDAEYDDFCSYHRHIVERERDR